MKRQMKRTNRKRRSIVLTIWIIALIIVTALSRINRQDVVAYCKNPAYGIRQMEEIDASDVETSRGRIIDAAREVVKRSASTYGGNVGGIERPTNYVLQNTVYYKWYGYQDDVTKHQFDLSCVNQTTHIIYQSTATKRRVDIQWAAGEWANGGWTTGRWQDISHRDLLSNSYSYYVTNGVVFQQLAVDRFWDEIRQYPKLYDVRRYEVLQKQNFDKSQVRMGDVLFTGYRQADGSINRMHCMFVIGKLSAEEKEGFVFDEACPWRAEKMFMASTGPEKNGRLVYTDLLDTPFAGDPGKGYYVYAVARPLFMPQPSFGGFMLKKAGSDVAALAGAEFDLIDEDGVTCRHITVPQDGFTSEMNLIPGCYTLVETKSPEGYVSNSTPYPLTIVANAINRVYWDNPITNERITGYIKIVKTDEEGAPIAGATFDVLKGSTVLATLTTNDSGEATTQSLPFGSYTVQETYVPSPYQLKEQTFTASITEHGKTEILNVQNEKLKVCFPIIKKDALTGEPLPGAHLQVIHEATGDLIDEWISDNTTHLIRYLTAGETYILREVEAPEGYVLAEEICFTVEGVANAQNVTMYNDRTRAKILKQDAKTNTPLSGVEFALYRAADGEEQAPLSFTLIDGVYIYDSEGEITTLITNDDGHIAIEKLPLGDYYCQETKSPEGYVPDSTLYPLTIVESATNCVYCDNPIQNERVTGYIKIVKTDERGTPIANATFNVLEGEAVIATLSTDDSGEAVTPILPFGTYTVKETDVPLPYQLKEQTFTVSITEHGKTEILNVQNEKIKVCFPVIKKDTLTGEPLPGAHLQVIHEATGDLVDEWVSGNTPHLIRYLTAGETYILREVEAPEGYVLAEEICFTVEGVANAQNVTMYNDRTRAKILKQDAETNTPLSGVEFALYRAADGEERSPLSFTLIDGVYIYDSEGEITTLITNDDGYITIEKLPIGIYFCKESYVPSPYLLKEEAHSISISEHGKTEILNVQNEKLAVCVRVIKKDALTGKPLSGAVFQIIDAQGAVVSFDDLEDDRVVKKDRFTTDSDGVAITEGLLSVGAYMLREIEAPQGYILMDDMPFEVSVDMKMTILPDLGRTVTLDAVNTPTEVLISKKCFFCEKEPEGENDLVSNAEFVEDKEFASEDKSVGEKELAGAHLQVIHEATGDLVDEWVSGNTPHLTRYLTAGETYILREVEAPEGYVLAEEIRFTVEGLENAQKVTMYNDQTRAKILKQDAETNTPLSGVEFALYRAADSEDRAPLSFTLIDGVYIYDSEGEITTLITNDDGYITIEKLPLGDYYCQETKVPEGYLLNDTLHMLTVNATSGDSVLLIENEAAPPMPLVIKTGEKTPSSIIPISIGFSALTGLGGVIILQRKKTKRNKD